MRNAGAVLLWLAIGAAVGVLDARRGYWPKGWVVSALLGPLAIPLALHRRRDRVAPSALNPEPWPEEETARRQLHAAAELLCAAGHDAGPVVLAGKPWRALQQYAEEEEYEVVPMGSALPWAPEAAAR